MLNKKTNWYNTSLVPKSMVEAAVIRGESDLLSLKNYQVLDKLVKLTHNCKTMGDVGCGASELGDIYKEFDYTGFDLPHIIDGVSKVINPNLKYIKFDAQTSDFSVFKNFDLIICNGFFSELPNPLEVLEKLLVNTKKYLIIHRQFFEISKWFYLQHQDDGSEHVKEKSEGYIGYGDLKFFRTYIHRDRFDGLLTNHKVIKEETNEFGKSLLIQKI